MNKLFCRERDVVEGKISFHNNMDICDVNISAGKHRENPCKRNNLCTFGHERVLPRACQCAVDLTDQLHVVQEGVEGVEVREADHVRGAATCSLVEERQRMLPFFK